METLNEQLAQALELDSHNDQEDGQVDEQSMAPGENPALDAEDGDEGEIRTLSDLIEANGWDAEELYSLEMAMPDSEEAIPLGKLKDELTTARRERESLVQGIEERDRQLQMAQAQAQNAVPYDQNMMQMQGQINVLQGFLQSPDYANLKKEDPGAAALKAQEIQQAMGGLQQQMQQYQMQQQQQTAAQRQQNLAQASQYLSEQIPEWRDPAVARAEKQEITKAIMDAGYTAADLTGLSDPRVVMLMRELVSLRRQVGAGKVAGQAVRQSPKASLRGGRIKGGGKKAQINAINKAKKTGSKQDVLAAQRAVVALSGGI